MYASARATTTRRVDVGDVERATHWASRWSPLRRSPSNQRVEVNEFNVESHHTVIDSKSSASVDELVSCVCGLHHISKSVSVTMNRP